MDKPVSDAQSDDPRVALPAIAELRELTRRLEPPAVERARSIGLSWEEIAGLLRSSRQAVHRKYRHLDPKEGRLVSKMSPGVKDAIREGTAIADSAGSPTLEPEHLFAALLGRDGAGAQAVRRVLPTGGATELLGFDTDRREGSRRVRRRDRRMSPHFLASLRDAMHWAKMSDSKVVSERHLLAATLQAKNVEDALVAANIDVVLLRREVLGP